MVRRPPFRRMRKAPIRYLRVSTQLHRVPTTHMEQQPVAPSKGRVLVHTEQRRRTSHRNTRTHAGPVLGELLQALEVGCWRRRQIAERASTLGAAVTLSTRETSPSLAARSRAVGTKHAMSKPGIADFSDEFITAYRCRFRRHADQNPRSHGATECRPAPSTFPAHTARGRRKRTVLRLRLPASPPNGLDGLPPPPALAVSPARESAPDARRAKAGRTSPCA
jgi:hypothetical protein